MSRSERRAYLHAIAARYLVAQRAQKSRMLDEYCATVRVSRKHAIAMIGRAIKALADEVGGVLRAPRRRTGRPRVYAADRELFAAIHTIWEAHPRPCGKRLVALLPNWLPFYEAEHGVRLSRQTRRLVNTISAASIDRLLAPTRKALAEHLRGLSGATPATEWLRSLVPVRTHHHDVDRPGCCKGDTVAHCGATIAGEFFWTPTNPTSHHRQE